MAGGFLPMFLKVRHSSAGAFSPESKSSLQEKNERGLPNLELVREVRNAPANGKIFMFDRQWTYHFEGPKKIDHNSATIEALARVDGVSFTFYLEIGDSDEVEELQALLGQLRVRRNDELPERSGFCFGNGIILDPIPTAKPIESTVLFAGWAERPDINIALSTMSGVKNDTTLLQRHADNSVHARYASHFKTIFKGRREINGIPGEELSERVKELNGTYGHSYMWESDTVKEADALRPFLTLELSTGVGRPGEPVNSSLPDKDVQTLWDQISGSLRLRQVQPASLKEGARANVERKETSVRASQSCPATGWWSCSADVEGHQVLGGATQHFVKGARMPQAQLLAPTTVLDKLKNHQPTFTLSTPTEWTLTKAQP